MSEPTTVTVAWVIDGPKIPNYLLDLTSRRGASKARYLMRFGFTLANAQALANALVEHAVGNVPGVTSVSQKGVGVIVFEGTVLAPDGRMMPLRTVWRWQDPNEMHFVTAVPLT